MSPQRAVSPGIQAPSQASTPAGNALRSASIKLHQLDALRGLCALAVVFYHVDFVHPGRELSLFRNGSLFVDFFFVLSGFIMVHSHPRIEPRRELGRFLGLRLFRIYPLHLAMLLVFLAYETLQWVLVQTRGVPTTTPPFVENDGLAFFLNLTLLNGVGLIPLTFNTPSWSISAELWTYVVFGTLVFALGARTKQLLSAFLLASLAAFVLLASQAAPSLTSDHRFFLVRCLHGFFLGAALRLLLPPAATTRESEPSSVVGTVAQTAALLLSVLLVCLPRDGARTIELAVPFGFAVLIAAFVRWPHTAVVRLLSLRPLLWLGTVSYSVYMVHMIVLLVVEAFARIVLHAPSLGDVIQVSNPVGSLMLAVYLSATLIAASLTYRLIERPARDYGRSLLRRPVRTTPAGSMAQGVADAEVAGVRER